MNNYLKLEFKNLMGTHLLSISWVILLIKRRKGESQLIKLIEKQYCQIDALFKAVTMSDGLPEMLYSFKAFHNRAQISIFLK